MTHNHIKKKKPNTLPSLYRHLDILFIIILAVSLFLLHRPLAESELLSPDASGYLDMGKNLFAGKGAVTSYNLYQLWPGKFHPIPPYMPPLYPIFAGFIMALFDLKAVTVANILFLALNCILLYKILRLKTDSLSSFLIALFMGIATTPVYSAIHPWTEQLHLTCLLLLFFIYFRYRNSHLWVGVLLAISFLIRVASIYNIAAFLLGLILLQGFSLKAFKEYALLGIGFLLIFLPYQLFCVVNYKTSYPEYIHAAQTYGASRFYKGAFYNEALPVLNMPPIKISADIVLENLRSHSLNMIQAFGNIKFIFLLVPLYLIYDFRKRKTPLYVHFFLQGIVIITGCIVNLRTTPIIEGVRYSLIPYIMFGSVGFLAIRDILINLSPKKRIQQRFSLLFVVLMILFLSLEIEDYWSFQEYYRSLYFVKYGDYIKKRDELYEWIRNNTAQDDLIASELMSDAFLHRRPFVSLPIGEALTEENVKKYVEIYQPAYVLTYNKRLIEFLTDLSFTEKRKSGDLVLLNK